MTTSGKSRLFGNSEAKPAANVGSRFVRWVVGGPKMNTYSQHRIGQWQPGQWRRIVATWNPVEQRVYIDGHLAATDKRRFPLEGLEPVEGISIGPGGSWSKGFIGHSLIDEFRLHDRPLSEQEIVGLYLKDADAALLDAGNLTVGWRTPEVDGRIGEWEYPLESAGFFNLRGLVAARQSAVAIAYDDDTITFAVRTPLDGEESMPGDEISIFLTTAPGSQEMRHLVFSSDGSVRSGESETSDSLAEAARFVETSEDGFWTLEAAIPLSALGVEQLPDGTVWRFNVGRAYADGGITSFAPVTAKLSDRAKFTELRFRKDAPEVRLAELYDMQLHITRLDLSARSKNPDTILEYQGISDNLKNYQYGLRMHRQKLFEKGRETPMLAPRGSQTPWYLPDFAFTEVRVIESTGEESIPVFRHRFLVLDERTPMVTRFFYTLDRKTLSVSAERSADGIMRVRFLRPDGTEAWRAEQEIPESGTYFDALFDLDFEKLVPGDYTVKVDYVAPDGKAMETWEQGYRIPGPDDIVFQPYVNQDADNVPAPWTPVVAEDKAVSTWGRSYDFAEGVLFSGLVTQGQEILAGLPNLRLNGKSLSPLEPPVVKLLEADDLQAEWSKTADLGPLIAQSEIITHFDGYCELVLTISPAEEDGVAIESLSLDIPLKAEFAELVRDGKLSTLSGSKTGAVEDYWHQKLIDAPFFWIGNNEVGFNWLAPSLEGWHTRDNEKNLEFFHMKDRVVVRLNLVDTPLDLNEPRTIRFGFTLTPTRPLDRTMLQRRDFKDYVMRNTPWEFFAVPEYDSADPELVRHSMSRRAEPGADEAFLYLGDGLTSPFHPYWGFSQQEWLALTSRRTFGEWTGSSPGLVNRNRHTYVEGDINNQEFRNFVNHLREEFLRRNREKPLTPEVTGSIFIDTGVGVQKSLRPERNWEAADGTQYGRLPIDPYRELWINLNRQVRRSGPKAHLHGHQGWLRVMPMQHFADIIVGGEGGTGLVDQAGGYFDVLDPDMFRATFSPYIWGLKTVFLDMNLRVMRESRPEAYRAFDIENPEHRRVALHPYGYCLAHDVDIYDHAEQTHPLRLAIWAAQDALGWDEEVEFHPYWDEDGPVRLLAPESDRILTSAYSKDGKLILVVLNDTDEEQEIRVGLDLDALGLVAGQSGRDIFSSNLTFELLPEWKGVVPARGLRTILWNGHGPVPSP